MEAAKVCSTYGGSCANGSLITQTLPMQGSNHKHLDWGGNIEMAGGRSAKSTGGAFILHTGIGTATSSGLISIVTANAGVSGVSGSLAFSSGTTTKGNSGMIMIGTGKANLGKGGDINIEVGTGNKGDGGNVLTSGGESTAPGGTGGNITIIGGLGSSTQQAGGGKGGGIYMQGGEARGQHHFDNGGNIEYTGGLAYAGYGGSFLLETGYGFSTSSGVIELATANAGKVGVSGHIKLTTGTALSQ